MLRLVTSSLAVAFLLSSARPASADLVTFRFSGTIDSVSDNLTGSVSLANPASFLVTWDTDWVNQYASTTLGYFNPGVIQWEGQFGELQYRTAFPGELAVSPNSLSSQLDYLPFTGTSAGGLMPFAFDWSVYWSSNVFSSAQPPLTMPQPTNGSFSLYFAPPSSGSFPSAQGQVSGTITRVDQIPEPSTLILIALGGALVWRRRQVRKSAAEDTTRR